MRITPFRSAVRAASRFMLCCLAFSAFSVSADYSPYDLKVIQPAAGLDSNNRFYRAYPGIEYNVQVTAIGGEYPYTYRLSDAPDGMEVSANSGVITWTPTGTQRQTATVVVTDKAGQSESVSWTIDVTKEKFIFVDSVNGSSQGRGTIDDPLKSVADIYGGTSYASKRAGTYRNHFIYFRSGNYKMDGFREDPRVQWTYYQPMVMMAYPGEKPNLDLSETYLWADTAIDNFYLEGFNVTEIATKLPNDPDSHKGFRVTGSSSNVTFRNNSFNNLADSEDTHQNQSVIMATAASSRGQNWAIVGNEFNNVARAYGIVGYSTIYVAVDGNTFNNFSHNKHAIGPKKSCEHWYIRNNRLTNIQGDAIWLYWAQESDQPFGNIEVSYNYVDASSALLVNQKTATTHLPLHVFRNTFVGKIEYRAIVAGSANLPIHHNIIVNDIQGTSGLSGFGINCVNCTASSKIQNEEDNQVFSSYNRNNIIDEQGRIITAKRDSDSGLLGVYGWEMEKPVSGGGQTPTPGEPSDGGDESACRAPRVPVLF